MEQQWPTFNESLAYATEDLEALLVKDPPIDNKLELTRALCIHYANKRDWAQFLDHVEQVKELSELTGSIIAKVDYYRLSAHYYIDSGKFKEAFKLLDEARVIADESPSTKARSIIINALASAYSAMGMLEKALSYHLEFYELSDDRLARSAAAYTVAKSYALLGETEKAIPYFEETIQLDSESNGHIYSLYAYHGLGSINLELGNLEKGIHYLQIGNDLAVKQNHQFFINHNLLLQSRYHMAKEEWRTAQEKLRTTYQYFHEIEHLSELYEVLKLQHAVAAALGEYEQAYGFLKEFLEVRQRQETEENKKQATQFDLKLEEVRQEKEFEKRLGEARLKTLAMLASEMAHEIQNPLQFVNNFSAINLELLDEQHEYLQSKDLEGIEEVRRDLLDNCGKIQEHGKRISKIVAELQDKTNKAQAGELELPTDNVHDFS